MEYTAKQTQYPHPSCALSLLLSAAGQQAGEMFGFVSCKALVFEPQRYKQSEISDLIHTSIFQMGKAFSYLQPGARAVSVTMK